MSDIIESLTPFIGPVDIEAEANQIEQFILKHTF